VTGVAPSLPEPAFAAALAALPKMGPAHLRRLLQGGTPSEAWAHVRRGHPLDEDGRWRRASEAVDPTELWSAHRRLGIGVHLRGEPPYPAALARDDEAPAVLFSLGDPDVVDRFPRVGIVGTRSATRYGLGVAVQLGSELAAAGVAVVSGLALGVDGAAHEGACAAFEENGAPPVAVVAGGLDRPYPARNARLWARVAAAGVVLSESTAGTRPEQWRFPLRNRIMAALSEVLVVVECHERGGSLHTVHAAERRGIAVGAVPGSVRSPASSGTNGLVATGCFPVRDTTDVLVALGLARAGRGIRRRAGVRRRGSPRRDDAGGGPIAPGARGVVAPTHRGDLASSDVPPAGKGGSGDAQGPVASVLAALGYEPCPIEALLGATGLSLSEASAVLEELAAAGVVRGRAGWWERA